MHDHPTNQAAGLLELAMAPSPKLMAMVSHGDEQSELPLLWRLCSSLVDFGYTVTVLDATTCESQANPGLEHLLDYAYWPSTRSTDIPEWNIIASGMGLQTLCANPEHKVQSLLHLGHLFQHEGVVILYGKAEWLVPLLSDSTISPLLALAPVKASLLTSYLALKYLLLKGRLHPTVVNLVPEHLPSQGTALGTVGASLSDCARNFLGYEVNALTIAGPCEDDRPCPTMRHLASLMLENAMTLSPDFPGMSPQIHLDGAVTLARSH